MRAHTLINPLGCVLPWMGWFEDWRLHVDNIPQERIQVNNLQWLCTRASFVLTKYCKRDNTSWKTSFLKGFLCTKPHHVRQEVYHGWLSCNMCGFLRVPFALSKRTTGGPLFVAYPCTELSFIGAGIMRRAGKNMVVCQILAAGGKTNSLSNEESCSGAVN